jgi:hypothetical protein
MANTFADWAILELMGHRRLAGYVADVEMFGGRMARIDIPDSSDPAKSLATQFYNHASIYALTPCTEATAREVARGSQPAPVQRWELPPAPSQDATETPDPEPAF